MWLFVPKYSLSVQEWEDSTSASDWRFQALAQSVWSKGKDMPLASWQRACKKGGWTRALFGLICTPLTAARGVGEFLSSLPEFPVSPTPLLAEDLPTKTRGRSGRPPEESSPKCGQQLLLWRMSPESSSAASKTSSRISMENWGTLALGEYTALPKPQARHTKDGESLFWPTAVAGDSKSCGAAGYSTSSGRHAGRTLTDAARQWATPTARDWKDGTSPSDKAPTNGLLGRQAPRAIGTKYRVNTGLQLSAPFVEALMGMPHGWTDFVPLETESSHNNAVWRWIISEEF